MRPDPRLRPEGSATRLPARRGSHGRRDRATNGYGRMTEMANQSAQIGEASRTRTKMPGILYSYRTEIAIAAAIVLLMFAVSLFVPVALSTGNIRNIIQAAAPLIIMSLGAFL